MIYIGIFILCIILATLSVVGIIFSICRKQAVWLLVGSVLCACLVVTWVYYPRSYARDYLTQNTSVESGDLSALARNKDFELGTAVRTLEQ